jgi:hypothetical protein
MHTYIHTSQRYDFKGSTLERMSVTEDMEDPSQHTYTHIQHAHIHTYIHTHIHTLQRYDLKGSTLGRMSVTEDMEDPSQHTYTHI